MTFCLSGFQSIGLKNTTSTTSPPQAIIFMVSLEHPSFSLSHWSTHHFHGLTGVLQMGSSLPQKPFDLDPSVDRPLIGVLNDPKSDKALLSGVPIHRRTKRITFWRWLLLDDSIDDLKKPLPEFGLGRHTSLCQVWETSPHGRATRIYPTHSHISYMEPGARTPPAARCTHSFS